MKVLKHGWHFCQYNKQHIVRCKDCECEFQYNNDDTYTTKALFPMIDESGKPQYALGKYVNCPECGNRCLLYWYRKSE